jgi:dimeric dUTPase (all-alpha-NTP-PPase superfamily)
MELQNFLEMQETLDDFIISKMEKEHKDVDVKKLILISKILALQVETSEFANELKGDGFKYWSKKGQTEKCLEEFCDIFFFWLSIANQMGYTVDDIEKEYKKKWQININRQKEGY